jgi:hypothetical protein
MDVPWRLLKKLIASFRVSKGGYPSSLNSSSSVLWGICSHPLAGVLDEPYSQLSLLSGVAVQARQSR